ncbi:MAG: alpha/beta hydrolase [Polyangiales bacterium]|nr:alpha/beta hydrolase [Myxococcales bacterium]
MNVIRKLMDGARPVVRARRAVFGPLRPTWSEDFEVVATVLRRSSNASTLMPLAWQRAVTDPPRPETRVMRETHMADVHVPSPAGPIPCMWFEAANHDPERALIYLHGGGYSIGSLRSHRDLICRIAQAARMRVLAPAYRLAPEHPFPAQLEDARAVYAYVRAQGVRPEHIVIAGESAGAGLTLSTALWLRDQGQPLPAALAVVSPWVDLEGRGRSLDDNRRYDFVSRYALQQYAKRFVPRHELRNPLAAPIHAALHDLPPLLIHVGAAEGLLDDALHLAERARDQGVDVTLQAFPDMIHAFHVFAPLLPVAREAIADIGAFARERTGATP